MKLLETAFCCPEIMTYLLPWVMLACSGLIVFKVQGWLCVTFVEGLLSCYHRFAGLAYNGLPAAAEHHEDCQDINH